jgi:N-ethylmaleimide reductase
MVTLFDPLQLGALTVPNRILISPLTRARGTHAHVATDLMTRYYAQRASAGLIISEAIGISREGLGWPYAAGLWNQEQIDAWRPVTAAVHGQGGRIAAQLWHMGRTAHISVCGVQPVSASDTQAPGNAHTYKGKQPRVLARALRSEEIPRIVETYRVAARHAMDAGFDMVQLHAANGYLIDQFICDSSNLRTDDYGGNVENRIRLLVEIIRSLASEVGAGRSSATLARWHGAGSTRQSTRKGVCGGRGRNVYHRHCLYRSSRRRTCREGFSYDENHPQIFRWPAYRQRGIRL